MSQTPYTVPGLKVLLQGESGSGKTHSIVRLLKSGVTPFVLFTENSMATLVKAAKDEGVDPAALRWHYVPQATQSWAAIADMGKKINQLSYDALTKVADPKRNEYGQFLEVVKTCNNFIDDRTGESFGDISTWGTDRAFIIDSNTGLSDMSMALTVGARPTKAMQDWMVAQNNLEGFLRKLVSDLRCHFILTAHIEPEKDEITGGIKLMTSTLGRKLAPKLPAMFDEVILAKHTGNQFHWSTAEANVALKSRLLGQGSTIEPCFDTLIAKWEAAGGVITPTETAASAASVG